MTPELRDYIAASFLGLGIFIYIGLMLVAIHLFDKLDEIEKRLPK